MLIVIFAYVDCLGMEIEKEVRKSQVKGLDLSEVTVNMDKIDQEDIDTIQLMYEALLKQQMTRRQTSRQSLPMTTPRQAVKPLKNELNRQVEALRFNDPEMYDVIMEFKKNAEANGRTPEEIAEFIEQNLEQLPQPIQNMDVYAHLYDAHISAVESQKKKDYALNEVLDENGTVDASTLLHTLMYRSPSFIDKESAKKEVERSKKYSDDWLARVKENDPTGYAMLMKAYEDAQKQNLNQQQAAPQLVTTLDQLNVIALQLLLKDAEKDHEVKTTTTSVWSSAYKLMTLVVTVCIAISGSVGGVFGGLYNHNANSNCTASQCIAMNITNCTNTTG